jgi:NAD(P)-dependent dehydrogenase (short-subunit alcohol dehydrogenase family)
VTLIDVLDEAGVGGLRAQEFLVDGARSWHVGAEDVHDTNSNRQSEKPAMTTTLITGANQGLGFHSARRLLALGHYVWATGRDPKVGAEAAREIGAHFVQLDITDDASVSLAAEAVAKTGGIDVIINNAGVADRTPVLDTTPDTIQRVLDTNVLGPVRVIHAFADLLDASACPVVVNVSSSLGSLALSSDPEGPFADINLLAYPTSKSALNMLTIQWARAHPRWRVNSADPGFTATNLNQYRGTQTVDEGTDAIVELACVGPDGPTGKFFSREGLVPW